MLGLRFCARPFSSCGEWGPLFIAVRRPLTIADSLVAEHRLQTRRLSSSGSRAHLLRGMWDPPRRGLEPMSPALAGRFSTTVPPGKPLWVCILNVQWPELPHSLLVRADVWSQSLYEVKNCVLTHFPDSFKIREKSWGTGQSEPLEIRRSIEQHWWQSCDSGWTHWVAMPLPSSNLKRQNKAKQPFSPPASTAPDQG